MDCLSLGRMKKTSKRIAFLIVLGFFAANQAWAQHFNLPVASTRATKIQGTFARQDGFRYKWRASQIDSNVMIKFSYLKNPQMIVYLPDKSYPIKIYSDKMRADTLYQDFIFEDHVIIEIPNGVLKTRFLNFNAKRSEMRSFDKFTYKTRLKTYHGRGLHGLANKREITLFNTLGHRKNSSILVQI